MRLLLILQLGVAAVAAHHGGQPAARDLSTKAIVAAAAQYVAEYERSLTAVIADEVYVQDVQARVPADLAAPRIRRMKGEIFFMFAPYDRHWMAIRDVVEIDGKRVPDSGNLRELLQTLPQDQVARTFKANNSRLNIGRVLRNFNEPTLSLLVLDAEHRDRFRFDLQSAGRAGDKLLATVAFVERERPTLITHVESGRPIFARGELVVDVETGRIHRATLRADLMGLRIELVTTYAEDARLGIWVPSVFRERYEQGRESRSSNSGSAMGAESAFEHERIVCEARYSNYRRFEVRSRIK